MAKQQKTVKINEATTTNTNADKKLQECMGKFNNVIVLGITKAGEFDIDTTDPHFPTLHYLLNKAIFELNLYEKNTSNNVKQKVVENNE